MKVFVCQMFVYESICLWKCLFRGIIVYGVVRKQFATGNVLCMQLFVYEIFVYGRFCSWKSAFM